MSDAAREEQGKWGPQSDGWEPAHPGRHWRSGPAGPGRGPQGDADLDPPGGWALVFMAFMLTVAAVAWGVFLLG